jgi:hypothetical protein
MDRRFTKQDVVSELTGQNRACVVGLSRTQFEIVFSDVVADTSRKRL